MNILLIIIVALAILYGLLIIIYWWGWKKLPLQKNIAYPLNRTPVTVIIPARNEQDNIVNCLRAITGQQYPKDLLEVIVMNDHSTDDTEKLVRSFPASNVRLINLSDHISSDQLVSSYKKKAIETGIANAKGELIINTDADCIMGPNWINAIVNCYEYGDCKLIAAPVAFYQENNFFKNFQSLDFLTLQGITGATIRLCIGTMCNGANLAYEKKAFYAVGGFTGIDCIASGDDMLLMYKIYKAYPCGIRFLKNTNAIVKTLPINTLRDFMQQRIRWSSKAGKYDDKRITAVLALVYLWNLVFPILIIAGFFHRIYWIWFAALLIYKTITELFFLFPVAKFFGKKKMLWQFFPAQFLHIPYVLMAGWLGVFSTYQWKGRRVK